MTHAYLYMPKYMYTVRYANEFKLVIIQFSDLFVHIISITTDSDCVKFVRKSNMRTVVMFVIFNRRNMFHTGFVGMFIVCFHTKLHASVAFLISDPA